MIKLLSAILLCFVLSGCTRGHSRDFIPGAPPQADDSDQTSPGEGNDPSPGDDVLENAATRRTMEMGIGWNLGNNLDAYE